MHVSQQMLDKDLQPYYYPAKMIAALLSKQWAVRWMHKLEAQLNGKNIKGLDCDEVFIPSQNGTHQIRIRTFRPKDFSGRLPGMMYIHGGGYMVGNPEIHLEPIKRFIETRPCVVVAPDYRKALDAPYPAAFDDCYDTLLWMQANAVSLGMVSGQFVVGGHSAGGGLTAAVSLKARDTGEVKIAFQLPIYPMIDDRQETESARDSDAPAWNSATNRLGWQLYLKDLHDQDLAIPAYAAAARADDYAGLPPTITFVGDLEPFLEETVQYVEHLKNAGVPTTFKIYPGCFHGFDVVAPKAGVSQDAWGFVLGAFGEYVDRYFD